MIIITGIVKVTVDIHQMKQIKIIFDVRNCCIKKNDKINMHFIYLLWFCIFIWLFRWKQGPKISKEIVILMEK